LLCDWAIGLLPIAISEGTNSIGKYYPEFRPMYTYIMMELTGKGKNLYIPVVIAKT